MNKSSISAEEGDRLAGARVLVDDVECGTFAATTVGGGIYSVKCNHGLGLIGTR